MFRELADFDEIFRYKIQQGRLINIIQDHISIAMYTKEENRQDGIFPQDFICRVSKYLDIVDKKFLVKSSMI